MHVRATIVAIQNRTNITYSESVFVAILAARNLYVPYCRLPGSKIFFHIISSRARFKKNKVVEYTTQNAYFGFLYNFCLKRFSFQDELNELWSKMYEYIGLRVKYSLFLLHFNETNFLY
jgi:hypothetical protein